MSCLYHCKVTMYICQLKLEESYMLKSISEIIQTQKPKVKSFGSQKVALTDYFKKLYLETMKDSTSDIYFYESFSIVKTSKDLKIYIPNQWFYLAFLGAPLAKELKNYKDYIDEHNSFKSKKEYEIFIKEAKNNYLNEDVFSDMTQDLPEIETNFLEKLLTDYDSWGGGKYLSRGDYYVSPILNLLDLVNVSSSYVADISYHLATNFNINDISEDSFFIFHEEDVTVIDYEEQFRQWIIHTQDSVDSNLRYINTLNRFVRAVNSELSNEKFVPISIWTNPVKFSYEFPIDKVMEIAEMLSPNTSFIPKGSQSGSELKTIYKKFNDWTKTLEEYNIDSTLKEENKKYLKNEHRQYIYFGAPGTGKSFQLDIDSHHFGMNVRRVTFHPNTSYGSFVGVYKPHPKNIKLRDAYGRIVIDSNNKTVYEEKITYNYVPGPLIKQLVNSFLYPDTPFLLIIEELNRANVAAVFGDLFQLLDRNSSYESEYPIEINEDLRNYFEYMIEQQNDNNFTAKMNTILSQGLIFPSNFYIWTTMNSADQGVMPIDTAFKRRWEQKYFGIDDAWIENKEKFFNYNKIEYKELADDGSIIINHISWNVIRRIINDMLSSHSHIPEDKLLGPYFLSENILTSSNKNVTESFKSKVLSYLFDDVVKLDRTILFKNVDKMRYSEIIKTFENTGLDLFDIPNEIILEYELEESDGNVDINEV